MFASFTAGVLTGVASIVGAVLFYQMLDAIFPTGGRLARRKQRKPEPEPEPAPDPCPRKSWVCPDCWGDVIEINGERVCIDCPLYVPTDGPLVVPDVGYMELPTLAEIDSGEWRPA